jgi:hypothetical protein
MVGRMRGTRSVRYSLLLLLAAACGGSERPASSPNEGAQCVDDKPCGGPIPGHDDAQASDGDEPSKSDTDQPADKTAAKPADVPAPSFKENGSVLDAINAVPQGTPRLNIEQEALGRPLGNVELYESCKPGNSHFKAKVAVWDGKAVGLDLTTTPKNAKFADCVAEKIRAITWPDKVKSLNVVEYTF